MTQLVKRDEIVTKHAKQHSIEIDKVIQELNKLMNESAELPVLFDVTQLGSCLSVRNEILRRIKQAGWSCNGIVSEETHQVIKYKVE